MGRIEAILERARRARAVLQDDTVMAAMTEIADQLQREWRATTSAMSERREQLFHQIAGLDATRGQLRAWVEQAEFEQSKLDKENQRRLRVVR